MELRIFLWIVYMIGCMIAMLQLMDDGYEESWRRGIPPEKYLSENRVIASIAFMSLGSWLIILIRWLNKR
jgi:hypothetical protein